MIEQIPGMPSGSLGFSARGMVTAHDYESVIVPDIEAAFALNKRVSLLYHLGEEFKGFEARAIWDDASLGLRHFQGWDRVAMVTDVAWLRATASVARFMIPADFRLFRNAALAEAMRWIAEPRDP